MKNNSNPVSLEPKEQCLFHYKEEPQHFYDMLHHGIWPRFCEEDFTWLVGVPTIIAFPVVCFCDIPLRAACDHRSTYGNFAVSISKGFAGDLDINPMWYLQEKSSITAHLASQMKKGPWFSLHGIEEALRPLLPFLKPTIGCQIDRKAMAGTIEAKSFEEEMEWRYCPHQLSGDWIVRNTKDFLTEKDHGLSYPRCLKLQPDQIEKVIVPTEEHRETVRREFPDLWNKVRTWDDLLSPAAP